ncbi:MAG TPA: alanine dehydrogenase, partial [Gemmatimonadetes bacterium]|nr:alanine dehydrogenase [Gemmatimonadota bacterium]
MLIGVPKEIKADEYRVALTPAGAEMLSEDGHDVVMESGAGLGSGFTDDFYAEAGVKVLDTAEEVWAQAEMIMKVKEPIHQELPYMRDGQVIFTYFHFAADESLTR